MCTELNFELGQQLVCVATNVLTLCGMWGIGWGHTVAWLIANHGCLVHSLRAGVGDVVCTVITTSFATTTASTTALALIAIAALIAITTLTTVLSFLTITAILAVGPVVGWLKAESCDKCQASIITPKDRKSSAESIKRNESETADVDQMRVHPVVLMLREKALLDTRLLQWNRALAHSTALQQPVHRARLL